MSIESVEYDGPVVLRCDSGACNKFIEFSSFGKAIAFKKKQREKQHGWRSFKEGDEWKDVCGDCCKAFAEGRK